MKKALGLCLVLALMSLTGCVSLMDFAAALGGAKPVDYNGVRVYKAEQVQEGKKIAAYQYILDTMNGSAFPVALSRWETDGVFDDADRITYSGSIKLANMRILVDGKEGNFHFGGETTQRVNRTESIYNVWFRIKSDTKAQLAGASSIVLEMNDRSYSLNAFDIANIKKFLDL